jgi:hypothetical protein
MSAALGLALHSLTACSLATVPRPPTIEESEQPRCATSSPVPYTDAFIGAVPAGVGTLVSLLCLGSPHCRKENPLLIGTALAGFAIAAPFFWSSHVGFERVEQCEAQWSKYCLRVVPPIGTVHSEGLFPMLTKECQAWIKAGRP